MPLLSLGLFHERVAITVKNVLQTSVWLSPTMSHKMCWHAFERSLLGKTRLWLKERKQNKTLCG